MCYKEINAIFITTHICWVRFYRDYIFKDLFLTVHFHCILETSRWMFSRLKKARSVSLKDIKHRAI